MPTSLESQFIAALKNWEEQFAARSEAHENEQASLRTMFETISAENRAMKQDIKSLNLQVQELSGIVASLLKSSETTKTSTATLISQVTELAKLSKGG